MPIAPCLALSGGQTRPWAFLWPLTSEHTSPFSACKDAACALASAPWVRSANEIREYIQDLAGMIPASLKPFPGEYHLNLSELHSRRIMSQQTPVERTPKNKETNEQKPLPVLPVRDTVLFPHAVLPLTVGRESSVQLINSLGEDKTIIVVAQREARVDAPQPSDLYTVGTSAVVHKVVKMPNQSLFVFAEGLERVKLGEFTQLAPFMTAYYSTLPEGSTPLATSQVEALQRNVLTLFQQIVAGSPTLSDELSTVAMNIDEPGRLVDFIASSLPSLSTLDKQDTLETLDIHVRLEKINQHLAKELEVQQLRNKIQSEVQDRVQQTQREYYLREQMKAIQKELGEQDEGQRDVEDL